MCEQRGWSRRGGSMLARVGVVIVLFLSLRAEDVRGEGWDARQTATAETRRGDAQLVLDVTDYDRLLHTYLTDDGWVDYAGLARDKARIAFPIGTKAAVWFGGLLPGSWAARLLGA